MQHNQVSAPSKGARHFFEIKAGAFNKLKTF
jgi:hypothetical protein